MGGDNQDQMAGKPPLPQGQAPKQGEGGAPQNMAGMLKGAPNANGPMGLPGMPSPNKFGMPSVGMNKMPFGGMKKRMF